MRRTRIRKLARTSSWSADYIMGEMQPPSPTRPRSRDTGFPEPFCGSRNTTLPHPDADLSPNACISADDINVNKVLHRSRRSFLAKNRRTISYGKIKPGMEQQDILLESEEEDLVPLSDQEKQSVIQTLDAGRREAGDSLDRTSGSSLGDGDDYRSELVAPESHKGKRRRSVLRKLRMHK